MFQGEIGALGKCSCIFIPFICKEAGFGIYALSNAVNPLNEQCSSWICDVSRNACYVLSFAHHKMTV